MCCFKIFKTKNALYSTWGYKDGSRPRKAPFIYWLEAFFRGVFLHISSETFGDIVGNGPNYSVSITYKVPNTIWAFPMGFNYP
jgi:hypothetical protein